LKFEALASATLQNKGLLKKRQEVELERRLDIHHLGLFLLNKIVKTGFLNIIPDPL
jgi:hypothetical protein